MPNYNYFQSTRHLNQNDGIVLYVHNSLMNVKVTEPNFEDANCLIVQVGQETRILAMYRSPAISNISKFLNSLDNILLDSKSFPNIVVTGDLNIDISSTCKNTATRVRSDDYQTLLASHSILPGHILSTRESACLDHCMIKTSNMATTIILPATITDHSPVLMEILTKHKNHSRKQGISVKTDFKAICVELSKIDWNNKIDYSDVNKASEQFITIVSNIITKYTTNKTVSRRKTNIKPWITPGLIRCMKRRDKLHIKFKKNTENSDIEKVYKDYRNICNKLLKKLKREHERQELQKNNKNSKETWKTIKRICNFPTKLNPSEKLLGKDNSQVESLNNINSYFRNVGVNLAHDILTSQDTTETTLAQNCRSLNSEPSSFGLLDTDYREIETIIKSLKNNSAPGLDKITTNLIKVALPFIIDPITHICQASFDTGVFPDNVKKSVISPIYKGGDEDLISNYRPISLLSVISKILEKLMNNRLKKYVEQKNLLSTNQYGFRTGLSTEDAVLDVTEYITKSLDAGQRILGIFLDLAKAFDTVSIPILLAKLESFGVRGFPLLWFQSYLSNRHQRTRIGEHVSQECNVEYGVPQGSILGPTLFLLYINDLCNISLHQGKVTTYADDTVILFCGRTWDDVERCANQGLNRVSIWLKNNLLTINLSKTKYINFTINNSTKPKKELKLRIHAGTCTQSVDCTCDYLQTVAYIKYLGVVLDDKLSWLEHIHHISGRIRKLIYVFKKLRHVMCFDHLVRVYYTLAQSILCYCIKVWGSAASSHMILLERAQRALLKVMTFKPRLYSTEELYERCPVLTVRQLFIKAVITKQHALVTTDTISAMEQKRRKDIVFAIPRARTMFGKRSLSVQGPRLYNLANQKSQIVTFNYNHLNIWLMEYLRRRSYKDTEKLLATLV